MNNWDKATLGILVLISIIQIFAFEKIKERITKLENVPTFSCLASDSNEN